MRPATGRRSRGAQHRLCAGAGLPRLRLGEPLPALDLVGPYVRSVHCKDATWAARPGVEWGAEVPLGEGAVGMEKFLRTLNDLGYTGPLTIEREIPQDPDRQKTEIGQAVRLISELKKKLAI